MDTFFEKEFELRYFEMNKFGVASPTAILTLLEETAAEHCLSINYSLYQLEKQHIGWVLVSGTIEMERYPAYKEKIKIKTWLSNYSTIKGYRENLIYDQENNIIGRAKGLWVFYDILKRRPAAIYEDIKTKWHFNSQSSIDVNIDKKIIPIQHSRPEVEFNVYKLDIDGNNHVSNIRYLHWLMESLPEDLMDTYYLKTLNGRFVAEAKYGDTVEVYLKEEDKEYSFLHTIKSKKENKPCAIAQTVWSKIT